MSIVERLLLVVVGVVHGFPMCGVMMVEVLG